MSDFLLNMVLLGAGFSLLVFFILKAVMTNLVIKQQGGGQQQPVPIRTQESMHIEKNGRRSI